MDAKLDKCASDYANNGFGVVEGFLTFADVEGLKQEVDRILTQHLRENDFDKTDVDLLRDKSMNDYFLASADDIRCFIERGLSFEDLRKCSTDEERKKCFGLVGHALYAKSEPFRRVCTSDGIKKLLKLTGFVDPVIVQGFTIHKNPSKVSFNAYSAHQDATYLQTTPTSEVVAGFWLALDEANEDNGCLQFWPKSHLLPVKRKHAKVQNRKNDREPANITVELSTITATTENNNNHEDDASNYVPVCAKPGTLVMLHGHVFHKSSHNASNKSRLIYTFHLFDAAKASWSPENWISPNTKSFLHVYHCKS